MKLVNYQFAVAVVTVAEMRRTQGLTGPVGQTAEMLAKSYSRTRYHGAIPG